MSMFSLPNQLLLDIAAQHGTPMYVYDLDHIRNRVGLLRNALGGGFKISYAMKCNPNASLLQRMPDIVDQLDVSSGGEITRAMEAGWDAEKLSFTGPAKRDAELRQAVDARIGHVIVESLQEAERLNAIAGDAKRVQSILLRISPAKAPPGFGSRMAGKPTQFGIDEEVIDETIDAIKNFSNVRIDGFHVYSGTQCLNPDALFEHFDATLTMYSQLCAKHAITPRTLVIGSGFGIPYSDNDVPLDIRALGWRIVQRVDQFKENSRFALTDLVLEVGRYIVGEAGVFLTRVVTTKISRGIRIAVCDGGMNNHLAAAGHMGSVIHRNYPMFKVSRDDISTESSQPQMIYGPLCTSIDLLANQVLLPPLAAGDLLAICSSGAYGLTSSPVHFISHPPCQEVIVEQRDGVFDVRPS